MMDKIEHIINNYSLECLFGYFDMGNGNCILCHFSCTGCSGPLSTDCISCPDY